MTINYIKKIINELNVLREKFSKSPSKRRAFHIHIKQTIIISLLLRLREINKIEFDPIDTQNITLNINGTNVDWYMYDVLNSNKGKLTDEQIDIIDKVISVIDKDFLMKKIPKFEKKIYRRNSVQDALGFANDFIVYSGEKDAQSKWTIKYTDQIFKKFHSENKNLCNFNIKKGNLISINNYPLVWEGEWVVGDLESFAALYREDRELRVFLDTADLPWQEFHSLLVILDCVKQWLLLINDMDVMYDRGVLFYNF